MNLAKAINILVAAKDDAVLASWVFALAEHDAAPTCDVSPYDAWAAYQQFFDLGLVSASDFRHTDPERVFFTHATKPTWSSIQGVLYTYAAIGKEPPAMSKPPAANPFSRDDTALSTKDPTPPMVPASRHGAMPLSPFGGGAAPASLNPFSTNSMGEGMRPAPLLRNDASQMFAPAPVAHDLPCRSADPSSWQIEPEVYCCKKRLVMAGGGEQIVGPDDLPGGSVSVIDAVFHAHCPHCARVWHLSVGAAINPDMAR